MDEGSSQDVLKFGHKLTLKKKSFTGNFIGTHIHLGHLLSKH